MTQLVHDFGVRYKTADVEDVDAYLQYLDEMGASRAFLDTLMERDRFETMRERLDEFLQRKLEQPDRRGDLRDYVNELGDHGQSFEDIKQLIDKTEHKGFIWDICQHLIMNPDTKTNCVMIYGAPNTGKTQFLQRLKQVFELVFYKQTRGHFDCRYKTGLRHPHFVICEEGCFTKLFDHRDGYQNAKLDFEGQGYVVE